VLAVKLAVVAPAATVTDAGTVSTLAIPPPIVTRDPPVGATWFSVTVQVVLAFDARLDAPHVNELTVTCVVNKMLNFCENQFSEADRVAFWLEEIDPEVAVNVAVVAAAATVTDAGTINTLAIPPLIVTVAPLLGAA